MTAEVMCQCGHAVERHDGVLPGFARYWHPCDDCGCERWSPTPPPDQLHASWVDAVTVGDQDQLAGRLMDQGVDIQLTRDSWGPYLRLTNGPRMWGERCGVVWDGMRLRVAVLIGDLGYATI